MAAPPPELGLLSVSTCPGIVLIWLAVIGPVLRSWSDGTTIPRSARCLLYGFDPAGMFLLFSCRNPNFRPLDANQGELGIWPARASRQAASGARPGCGVNRFSPLERGS